MRHFKVVMASCCCLVFAQAATAQMFTGVSASQKIGLIEENCGAAPCPPIDCGAAATPVDVCNVFVEFDAQFPDVKMLSVTMSDIVAEAPFFQNAFGVDTSPPCAFIPVFPDLQCDTFVTMGRKNTCPGDATNTDPDFLFGANTVTGGWFNSDPTNNQGHPQPTAVPGVNQVLIAQFAVPVSAPPSNVTGMVMVSWQAPDGGTVQFSNGMFECIPTGLPCDSDPGLCSDCQECIGGPDADPNGCANLPLSTACDLDMNLCTGDHCDGQGACVPFPAGDVICADPNPPCDGGEQCDPATGECVALPDAPASTDCELDGDLCTGEHCDGAGACVTFPAGDVVCQDPVPPCEGGEACEPATGECIPLPDAAASTDCELDGDLCTGEHCDGAGACVDFPAGDVICQDPVPPCEGGEACEPATGECVPLPDAAASTDCELDGDLCTGEHCDGAGACVTFPAGDVVCQDPLPPCEGGEVCEPATGACIPLPDAPVSTDCELDGDLCTGEHCDGAGACVTFPAGDVVCQDPAPPCEGGEACEPATGECIPLPDAAASTDCELDGDLCTGEHCDGAGACVTFPAGDVICQDANPPCEGGEICDPGTGECVAQPDAAASTMCEADGDLCTNDHCDGAGNCVFLSDVMCQDPNPPCEGGEVCEPATGACIPLADAPASTDCELDGDLCTGEHCDGAGNCVDFPAGDVICQDPNPPCEGGEACEPASGECVPLPDAAASTDCELDGDLCTGEHCDGAGSCVDFPAGDVICQDAVPPCEGGEICDPGSGNCVTQPDAAASTTCEADGDLCTNDHCDGLGNCVFLSDVVCQDPNPPCEGGEICVDGNCVPQADAPLSTDCELDGNECTGEHCDGAGNCVDFPDGDVMCQDPVPPCEGGEQCNPVTGECEALPDAALSTDCELDGDLCTGEHCDGAGSCVDFPDGDVVCQPADPPCEAGQQCNPSSGQCEDLPDAALSTGCEADGDLCTNDHCDGAGMCILLSVVECPPGEICDPATGMCEPPPECMVPEDCPGFPNDCTDTQCIDNTCVDNVLPDGTMCGNQNATECDAPDSCQMGVCVPNFEAVSTQCDNDGDLCTGDHCDGKGNCQDFPAGDVICADPLPPCEAGEQCNPASGECEALPDAPSSTLCELDDNLCTGEHCDGQGNCVDFPAGDVMCQDPNPPCEGGEQCDPGTGICVPLPDAPLSTECEADGDLCTTDHCDGAGNCILLSEVMCQPPIPPCEAGQQCNPATGMCEDLPDAPMSTTCNNDGDLCTGEHCDGAGSCVDFPAADVICQDANPPCEGGELCDPGTGECVAQPDAAVSTMCEADGDLCTNDHCDGIGNCVFLSDVICQDPVPPCEGGSECDPGSGMCVDLPDAPLSTNCESDGDLCSGEHCDGAGSCVDYPEGDVICPEGESCDPDSGMCVPDVVAGRTLVIKQGACPAPLNPNSNGVLPTVLVGDFDFDVFDVDLASLQLCRCDGVGGCVAPVNGPPGPKIKYADLNHPFEDPSCGTCSCNEDQSSDGITDIKMKFKVSDLVEVLQLDAVPGGSIVVLELNGQLSDGSMFSATDCVTIRPPGAALPDSLAVESNIAETYIDVTPLDLLYDEGGFASFVRWYPGGTTATLTAPVVNHAGLYFAYWEVNGVAQPTGQRTLTISVTGDVSIEAVYRPGRLLQPENLPAGFQRPDGSFGSGG